MRYAPLVLLAAVAAVAAADDVILVSGGVISNCKVVYEGADNVVVKSGGVTMTFPRGEVLRVVWGKVEEPPPRKTYVSPAAKPEPKPAAEAEAEAETPPPRRRAAALIGRLISQLASEDESARESARFALIAVGKRAYPALASALTDNRYWVRLYAARIFGQLRRREAAKALLDALYAAVPDAGRCPSWNRPYVRAVRDALRSTTGMSFGLNPRSQTQGRDLRKWVEWWEKSYKDLPPQIGEEPLDPASEGYEEKLKEARKLNLRKKSFPKPSTWQPATSGEY